MKVLVESGHGLILRCKQVVWYGSMIKASLIAGVADRWTMLGRYSGWGDAIFALTCWT